ncbi:MAG TPA: hypothetical protein VNV66_19250 [Pilimelia sp.]|nr:hypothetical protein [Pilimelia sp.]
MKVRFALLVAAAVSGLLAVAVAPASAASARPVRPGGGFVAETGVTTVVDRIGTARAVAGTQAAEPESICWVDSPGPRLTADRRVTVTWTVDCRSRANPQVPATDVQSLTLRVRLYQGIFNVWEPGRELDATECLSLRPSTSCTATSDGPAGFGVSYYGRLDVSGVFTAGPASASFITANVRFV